MPWAGMSTLLLLLVLGIWLMMLDSKDPDHSRCCDPERTTRSPEVFAKPRILSEPRTSPLIRRIHSLQGGLSELQPGGTTNETTTESLSQPEPPTAPGSGHNSRDRASPSDAQPCLLQPKILSRRDSPPAFGNEDGISAAFGSEADSLDRASPSEVHPQSPSLDDGPQCPQERIHSERLRTRSEALWGGAWGGNEHMAESSARRRVTDGGRYAALSRGLEPGSGHRPGQSLGFKAATRRPPGSQDLLESTGTWGWYLSLSPTTGGAGSIYEPIGSSSLRRAPDRSRAPR